MPSATKSCSGSDEHAGGQRHEAPTQATSRTSITSTEPGSAQVTETRRQRPLAGERREAMVTCTLNDADRHDMSATPPYSVQQHATHCLPACPPACLPACGTRLDAPAFAHSSCLLAQTASHCSPAPADMTRSKTCGFRARITLGMQPKTEEEVTAAVGPASFRFSSTHTYECAV